MLDVQQERDRYVTMALFEARHEHVWEFRESESMGMWEQTMCLWVVSEQVSMCMMEGKKEHIKVW